MTNQFNWHISNLTIEHLEAVIKIEKETYSDPWTMAFWNYELKHNSHSYYLGAWAGEELIGYGGMRLLFKKAHITNLTVKKDWQNKGVGTSLMAFLLEEALKRKVKDVVLEVRESNYNAQKLYSKFFFKSIGVFNNYYKGEKAVVMVLSNLSAYRGNLNKLIEKFKACIRPG